MIDLAWKHDIIPGLLFVSMEQTFPVYGRVLQLRKDGLLWTYCFAEVRPSGEELELEREELTAPLSLQQFSEARRLKWSADIDDLTHILNLPPD